MLKIQPDLAGTRVQQAPGPINVKSLAQLDQLVLVLPESASAEVFEALPEGRRLAAAFGTRTPSQVPSFSTRLDNQRQTLVVAGTIATDASAFERLTLGRKLVAAALGQKAGTLGIATVGFGADEAARIAGDVLAAALAAAFAMPAFKSKPQPAPIKRIRLLGHEGKLDTSRIEAEANGNNLARWLTALPPNLLDAPRYAELARTLAREQGWQYKRFASRELEKLGAGAFLAVAQGNDNDSAGIVRLRYRPRAKARKVDLALVGKGIIFDTGGTNLKPFEYMLDMHGDMQGSAVALGTLLAITKLRLPIAVDCWLALTENRTGPTAYKSQDLVTAANGKTIQTIHTDAEGRMALADTLVLASREKPGLMVDFATLTGSCVRALTPRFSGVFTNREVLHAPLRATGERAGERVWPFPIGKEFLDDLKSETADFMQCSVKGVGDHILAGSFLAEFIENDVPWVHMDLSAAQQEKGLAHVATKFTGFGVRYTMSAILDDKLYEDVR